MPKAFFVSRLIFTTDCFPMEILRYGREAKKKKVGAHFYFSIGAFCIASVDPPFKESTDPGLNAYRVINGKALVEHIRFC